MDYPYTLKYYPGAHYYMITPGYTFVFDRAFSEEEKVLVARAIRQERLFGDLDLNQVPADFRWAETTEGASVVRVA